MQKKCIATVLTPYYDEAGWMLQRNIKSVREQKLPENCYIQHVVVIDRGPEEMDKAYEGLAVLDYLEIPQKEPYECAYFGLSRNMGLPSARNAALKAAKGDFIFLLDTDDAFAYPERVVEQIGYMLENNLDHSYGGYAEIHGNSPTAQLDKPIMPDNDMEGVLKRMGNPCYCGSNCFRKSVINEVGDFDASMRDGAEDMEFWIRIAKSPNLKSGAIQKVLYYLGVHSNNMTAKYIREGKFDKAYKYMQEKHKDFFTPVNS